MQEVLEFLIKAVIDEHEGIEIESEETDKNIDFRVKVADGELGKLIGRKGKTINAIRTMMKAASRESGKKVNVEVLD
ncbi:MAG: KH domain-containing protein [Candidatus Muiribacteriaceae bacterium]